MLFVGWIMVLIGAAVMGFSFTIDVSVASPDILSSDRIINSGLVAQRALVMDAGVALFVAGWVAVAAALIVDAMEKVSAKPIEGGGKAATATAPLTNIDGVQP